MHALAKRKGSESKARFGLMFVFHQIIATWVVYVSTRILLDSAFNLLGLLGWHYSLDDYYRLVSGTPYFPVQIALAVLLGWLLGRNLGDKSMFWVWILPLAFLCYAFVAIPTLTPSVTPWEFQAGAGQSRISHYFGWGCRPANRCIDQISITLPFYVSTAYSLAALLAQRRANRLHPAGPFQFWILLAVGTIFVAGTMYDFVLSFQFGWSWEILWKILPFAATPFGIGAYLILLAFNKRNDLALSCDQAG